ncbi:MAG: substrate-binding domain-containing protein [Planctomycetes bacterium]|nr:substrate-binding domain-containing protein [Planctomycetota bacterium]
MPREAKRAGAVNGMSLMLLGSVAAVAGLTILLTGFGSGDDGPNEIHFYCAAGMREPMKEIARQYKDEFGVSIRLTYGGSGDLLSQIELHENGDL